MAGRLGFGSSASVPTTMIVTNTPAADLALTNFAYCSPSDIRRFSVPGSKLFLALVGDSIRDGHISLNAIQRRHARVSTGDTISVSRFIPPDNFNLALITLELEFVKKGTKNEQVDAVLLTQQLRKRFIDQIANQREATSSNIFRQKEFNLQSLGIGGLSAEFADIFRRAFASRVFPPHVTNKLGIKHVKGMLLFGPPGTGKTLMARQIGKMLNGKEPKIVNGPEVLSKFVGETEKNVRDLFADAENDQRTLGDQSELHVIIFDEIDAIFIFNTMVTGTVNLWMDTGVRQEDQLEMVLEFMIALPGRLEVQVEISLPDENGRLQILQIHTNKMKENSFIAPDVNLQELAARTKNYSGAELEGVVKSAVSFALNRQLSLDDLTKPVDEESIKVTMDDFLHALQEIIPAFGASTDDLERCRPGMDKPNPKRKMKRLGRHIYKKILRFPGYAAIIQLNKHLLMPSEMKEKCYLIVNALSNHQVVQSNAVCKKLPNISNHAVPTSKPMLWVNLNWISGLNGMVECGARHNHIYQRAMLLVEQVKVSKGSPLITCLLEGPGGSGKTAMAATVGIDSDFPYVKIISAESMIGLSESSKCAKIVKVFEDAYKSQLSIIVLDDIERLLEYVAIGPRFSNLISQTLLVLLKRLPPKGKNMLVIGTTSEVGFLEPIGICDAFSVTYHVPTLKTEDAKKVLTQLNVFAEDNIDAAAEALNDMPIKKLYMLIEMAAQGERGGAAEAIYSGKEKINISHFFDCLGDIETHVGLKSVDEEEESILLKMFSACRSTPFCCHNSLGSFEARNYQLRDNMESVMEITCDGGYFQDVGAEVPAAELMASANASAEPTAAA
ncbi:hypothetical protein HHK36_003690 [Tetracentron sinense]|uniref:Vesicle-fusing ATPase n=1 Tax=Tetracentron sinense TaxID=13715 RepID=A0A834ZRL0_TETSI|nr:hypothetical protein HHK36_003690 [Tetracentron sinense]